MEMMKGLESRNLVINELTQGRELAKQLQKLLDPSVRSEMRDPLMDQILSTYNNALNLVNLCGNSLILDPSQSGRSPESPRLLAGSRPRSSRSSDHEDRARSSKKRKTLPRRIEMVKVSSRAGEGLESFPSDGYSWRKYGHKHILGAKFRRSYYRCTHRHSQGCLALKQVQRSDEDQTLFHVIYAGDHTCIQSRPLSKLSTNSKLPPVYPELKQQEQQIQVQLQQSTSSVSPQLKVETENLENRDQDSFFFRSFSFSKVFDDPDGVDLSSWLFTDSPVTSYSDHFPASPAARNGVWTPESDLHEGVSTPNSMMNSPIDGLEFTLDDLGIDPNFSFDNPELFS